MDAKEHTLALYLLDALNNVPDAKVPALFRIARSGGTEGEYARLVHRLEEAHRAGSLQATVEAIRNELW